MDIKSLYITSHAWERFISRWPGAELPSCPMFELQRLLDTAVEDDIGDIGRAVRIINNGFEDARYFTCDGWRFILSADGTSLVTCERIIWKKQGPKKFKRRRR